MSRYSATGKNLATVANSNLISFRSSASSRIMMEELYIYCEAATALNAALFLTTVVDTGGTAVALQKEDNGAGSPSTTVVTVPTGGTLVAVASKRSLMAAVIGSGIIWAWPPGEGLIVPPSLSLILRNDGAVGPAITWGATVREV